MTPETLLPASSSGERRRAAQEPRPPVHAWDPNGPSAPVAPILWDALRDSVLWAEAEWERVVEKQPAPPPTSARFLATRYLGGCSG